MSGEFDNEAHEAAVNEKYRRLAKYDAFDALVDLALDGTITRDEALKVFKEDYAPEVAES